MIFKSLIFCRVAAASESHIFVWSEVAGMSDLGTLGGEGEISVRTESSLATLCGEYLKSVQRYQSGSRHPASAGMEDHQLSCQLQIIYLPVQDTDPTREGPPWPAGFQAHCAPVRKAGISSGPPEFPAIHRMEAGKSHGDRSNHIFHSS